MEEVQAVLPPAAAAPQRYEFRFTGQAREYFRIWIVNLALTLLTLGIYSAWAKVRSARYFYAHTQLAGSPFEYLGQPLAVLRGRLVAALVLVLYALASKASPLWLGLFMFVMMLATPFLVVMAMRFHLRMSSWRGVRFGFDGQFGEAAVKYLGWPLLLVPTLGLLLPYIQYQQKAFLFDRARFGATAFRHSFAPKQFYVLYLKNIAFAALGFLCVFVLSMLATIAVTAAGLSGKYAGLAAGAVTGLLVMPVYIGSLCYFTVRLHNLLWNNIQLGEHRFESRLSARKMGWLLLSNALAALATLGLAYPWAKIRLANYRAASTTLIAAASLDTFLQSQSAGSSAVGEQISEVLDMDLGL